MKEKKLFECIVMFSEIRQRNLPLLIAMMKKRQYAQKHLPQSPKFGSSLT